MATICLTVPRQSVGGEDRLFDAATSYLVKELAPDRFWQVLKRVSQKKLVNILRPNLRTQGRGCAVDVGTRTASLGCLVPSAPPQIEIDAYDKVRMHLTDGAFTVYLSVTDLRFYRQGQKTAREDRAGCSTENRQGVDVILNVGLGRAWQKPGDTARQHWPEVNNVHLEVGPRGGWDRLAMTKGREPCRRCMECPASVSVRLFARSMADWRHLSLRPFILCPLDVVREHVTRIALGRLTN